MFGKRVCCAFLALTSIYVIFIGNSGSSHLNGGNDLYLIAERQTNTSFLQGKVSELREHDTEQATAGLENPEFIL